jgi:hypothetical protein
MATQIIVKIPNKHIIGIIEKYILSKYTDEINIIINKIENIIKLFCLSK